jgi:hypothetical protein
MFIIFEKAGRERGANEVQGKDTNKSDYLMDLLSGAGGAEAAKTKKAKGKDAPAKDAKDAKK